jgi:hypothetical protein
VSNERKGGESKEAGPADKNLGWRVIDRVIPFGKLKNPRDWLAFAVYIVAAIFAWFLLSFILYILGLGFVAFVRLGHEIVSGGPDVVSPTAGTPASGSGSLTVFFTVLGALIGGPLIIWRVITAHVQAQAARDQADTAREGHYTDLFTKAVELLGATREVKSFEKVDDGTGGKRCEAVTKTEPNLEVRRGAIYAFDRVARDSERDHWPIMQMLCDYVRNPKNSDALSLRSEGIKPHSKEFYVWLRSIGPPRVDVQAALTVIGERLERRRELEASRSLRLDLRHANLQCAALESKYFERANFDGAHLDGARFNGAHLDGASLHKAFLDGAWFDWAHLDGALFLEAHLDGAWFDRAHLDGAAFYGAHLAGATFAGASFFNADLSKARSLDPAALASALGDASTKLPDGMERPAAWPDRKLSGEERVEWIKKARAERPKEP